MPMNETINGVLTIYFCLSFAYLLKAICYGLPARWYFWIVFFWPAIAAWVFFGWIEERCKK